MPDDSARPYHAGKRQVRLRYNKTGGGTTDGRATTRSANSGAILGPEEHLAQAECCAPECEAPPIPDMPLGIPLCRHCMRSILEQSLTFVRYAKTRSIVKNQKPLPGPVRDAGLPHEPVVYYVRFQNLIKIGYTGHLARRMQSIPHQQILAVEPGGHELEAERHAQFAHHRETGEWFRPGPDLIEHIKQVRAARVAA